MGKQIKVIVLLQLPGGLFEDRFEASVKMSTYLVAFVVCDYKSISKNTSRGVKVPERDQKLNLCKITRK